MPITRVDSKYPPGNQHYILTSLHIICILYRKRNLNVLSLLFSLFFCRGDSSPANRSLEFLEEANPPLRTALEARRLRRCSSNDHEDEVLSDSGGSSASEEAGGDVTRKSSMESVTSNDSGMASNLSEDGGNGSSRKNSEVQLESSDDVSSVDDGTNLEGNNNSLPKEVSYAELELLKKLEEQNRQVEISLIFSQHFSFT